MSREELAGQIEQIGQRINAQQKKNMKLIEKLVPALQVGLDLPTLQKELSTGVNRVLELGEQQNTLIAEYFASK